MAFTPSYLAALHRIVAVVLCRACKKVTGIAARFVIATVTNDEPVRNWAMDKLIGHSVSHCASEAAISVAVLIADPRPTLEGCRAIHP
jgi:hypothetical protein